jgi:flavin reductase (DIM6/NTAB) family NADH-FMN oxidoreductase RutF
VAADADRHRIAKQHDTWGLIESTGRFALHLLPSDDLDTVWRFGLASGHQVDKFADLALPDTPGGNPRYPGVLSWLDCRVEQRLDSGDRSVYLAGITGGALLQQAPVLTVATLLRDAPPERKAALDRLYTQDQAIDHAAILAWRRLHQSL